MKPARVPWTPLAFSGVLIAVALLALWQLMPSNRLAAVSQDSPPLLLVEGTLTGEQPLVRDGAAYLPITAVKSYLDPSVSWDPGTRRITITTSDKLIKMKTGSLTAYVNRQPLELGFPAIMEEGIPYFPADVLGSLYGARIEYHDESRSVVMDRAGKPHQTARVSAGAGRLRTGAGIKHPLVARLKQGEEVRVYGDERGWYLARTQTGHLGYIRKSEVTLGVIEITPPVKSGTRPHPSRVRAPGTKINLTWELVTQAAAGKPSMGRLPGVNVISPTWFELISEGGDLKSLADLGFSRWAHSQGYEVWALVNNGFDPGLTHGVLADESRREKLILQLLMYADLYELDGINIDFENVYPEDRDNLVQFVRELAPLAHEAGLTVSVDVTVKSQSPNWSLCYDRKALAGVADYIVIMTYDQHPAKSPVAGPVAALPWVEEGLIEVLQEVPAEKLVLGVPFYTRLWKEEPAGDGSVTVSSRALSMEAAERTVRDHKAERAWDPSSGQYLAQFQEGSTRYKVWIEDDRSMAARAALVQKYGLAGIASWRRGYEKPSIWQVIAAELNRKPF